MTVQFNDYFINLADEDLVVIPFKYKNVEYTLREIDGEGGAKWRNALVRSTVMEEGKVVRMENVADTDFVLLEHCIFDSEGKKVTRDVLRTWPNKLIKPLVIKARQISELDETPTEESLERDIKNATEQLARVRAGKGDPAKNGLRPTMTGSV